jgi:hypothetical protein
MDWGVKVILSYKNIITNLQDFLRQKNFIGEKQK